MQLGYTMNMTNAFSCKKERSRSLLDTLQLICMPVLSAHVCQGDGHMWTINFKCQSPVVEHENLSNIPADRCLEYIFRQPCLNTFKEVLRVPSKVRQVIYDGAGGTLSSAMCTVRHRQPLFVFRPIILLRCQTLFWCQFGCVWILLVS